jgi:hypothetical protein
VNLVGMKLHMMSRRIGIQIENLDERREMGLGMGIVLRWAIISEDHQYIAQ